MDEATSALDAESETLVNQAVTALLRGDNTTISIAHRLSTIKRADRIVCLGNDGRVAEEGSFEELSQSGGAFARLMEWQINGGEVVQGERGPRVSEREEMEAEEMEAVEMEAEDVEDVEADGEVKKDEVQK